MVPRLLRICRIQWSCSLFCFRLEILFFGKFGPKNQNCVVQNIKIVCLNWNLLPNSNMQNLTVMFTFFIFDWKYSLWSNLVPKVKIVCLKWKLTSRLILICKILWRCSLPLFWTRITLFEQIWSKKSKLSV